MVLGTPTTFRPMSACRRAATPRVSSPPITTSASTPSASRVSATLSTPPSVSSGLVREEPRMVPPRGSMPRTAGMSSRTVSPSRGPRQPSRKPVKSYPYSWTPLRTIPRMTALSPGQSPPPVSTPTRMEISIDAEARGSHASGACSAPVGGPARRGAERDVHVVEVVGGDAPAVLHGLPAAAEVDALLPDHVGDAQRRAVLQRARGEPVAGGGVDHEVDGPARRVVGGARPARHA